MERIFKVVLKKRFNTDLEDLRRVGGDYNPEVFFWDIMFKMEFGSIEELEDMLKWKVGVANRKKIKIVEVCL